jgi:NTP pyrophosphatase (non-canonical NTP hydrolase)
MNKQSDSLLMNDYQSQTATTAVYPGRGSPLGLVYCALKLSGESGEVSENVGKAIRDDGLMGLVEDEIFVDFMKPQRRENLKKELGDVLWYISQACTELGFSMAEVAQANLDKLADRKARGVIKGSGDDR